MLSGKIPNCLSPFQEWLCVLHRRARFIMRLRLLVAALIMMLLAVPAFAVVEIDITKGNVEPLPVAVAQFSGSAVDLSDQIARVIESDLRNSGLFRPIERAAFLDKNTNPDVLPNFGNWQVLATQALVIGSIDKEAGGRLKARFRLWDVFSADQLAGEQYVVEREDWRRIAHMIADEVYRRLTGESGYFDTRIVFVAESGPKTKRIKRLAIMDQDGANLRYLTDGRYLVLTPRFSPTSQEITYISYEDGQPKVYLLHLETGQRELVSDYPGMNFSPRFSPDGRKVIMSLPQDTYSNIFTMDLGSRKATRITNTIHIDVSPSYSPDGGRIVFTSNRGGRPQLYVSGADGGNPQRISFGTGSYSTPVWSPRGDLIAFTKQLGSDKFQIGVMKPDGSGERILAEDYLIEGPTWSPNGRVLMFFREARVATSGPKLASVDLTGYNERAIPTETFASDPAWSPLRQ